MFTEQRIEEILNQLSKLRYPQEAELPNWRMEKRRGETRPLPGAGSGLRCVGRA